MGRGHSVAAARLQLVIIQLSRLTFCGHGVYVQMPIIGRNLWARQRHQLVFPHSIFREPVPKPRGRGLASVPKFLDPLAPICMLVTNADVRSVCGS